MVANIFEYKKAIVLYTLSGRIDELYLHKAISKLDNTRKMEEIDNFIVIMKNYSKSFLNINRVSR